MSTRTSMKMHGMPGGRVEYPGDLPNIQARNVDPTRTTSWGQRLTIPAATAGSRSTIVDRSNMRGGTQYFYSNGALPMRTPIPGPPAYGSVLSSAYQKLNKVLAGWQLVPTLFAAGYPRNLGVSMGVPQLVTNASGGPGNATMQPRAMFDRVQQIPRSRAFVRSYQTRSAR